MRVLKFEIHDGVGLVFEGIIPFTSSETFDEVQQCRARITEVLQKHPFGYHIKIHSDKLSNDLDGFLKELDLELSDREKADEACPF